MSNNPYGQACRYLAKREQAALIGWLLRLPASSFRACGWIDARRVCFPGEPERTCDTVAFLQNLDAGGEPWGVALEFQIEPDANMFGRLLGYLGALFLEARPTDRFFVGAVVVNLTGRGNASRDMRWRKADLATSLGVCERNLAEYDADKALRDVKAGRAGQVVLPFIPLMQRGGEDGIIQRWVDLASAEPDEGRRGDYGGLALIFAEAAGRRDVWKKALEGWNVIVSQQVLEWQAQAREQGIEQGVEQGVLIGRIGAYQRMLRQPLTERQELRRLPLDELRRLADRLEAQALPRTNGHA